MQELRGFRPRIEAALAAIGRAAVDPRGWDDVLDSFAEMFPGARLHFWGTDSANPDCIAQIHRGHDAAFGQSFIDHYRHINPWWLSGRNIAPGITMRNADVVPDAELERTEFYNDWILPQEDIIAGGGQLLLRDRFRSFYFGANIPRRHRESAEPSFLRVLDLVAPAMREALAVNRDLISQRGELAANRAGAGTTGAGLLALGADGRVILANAIAADLLDAGRHVRLDAAGRLTLTAPAARHLLNRPDGGGIDRADSVDDGERRLLRLVRLPPHEAERIVVPDVAIHERPSRILVLGPAVPQRAAGSLLPGHTLTTAEIEVVMGLSSGLTPKEIAESRGASVHTVRNQIKSALAKTGLRRQSELAVLGARAARA